MAFLLCSTDGEHLSICWDRSAVRTCAEIRAASDSVAMVTLVQFSNYQAIGGNPGDNSSDGKKQHTNNKLLKMT